ncbi:hypothetical protein AGLY_002057 [Aphis glycines]|uniref:Integrase catalytic domain-containing protein n=1 Tax=Aphis glycines TaxID=307491 RepID=A0A6G0U3G2_APHGL|nr:hypothetical protein AGLY_002057 [Aphis glycines]
MDASGKADILSIVTEIFKPIIEPLNEIQKSTLDKNIDNTEDLHFYQIDELLDSYSIDKTYGPKLQPNKTVRLGKKEIKLVGNTIIVDDTTYPLTQGFRTHLTSNSKQIKKGGNKYRDIITPLFLSGGLSVQLQKHTLQYWNDPNELVSRLKPLLASKAAGNTGVSNKILSIFEELREVGYIKHCFTKFAWVIALKSKTAKEVSNAMSKILLKRSPKLLQLDNGKEFYNTTFDKLMKKYNIHKYSTYSTMKACIVERFNRTLKKKKFREFTARGMTPAQAHLDPTSVEIKTRKIINRKNSLKIGDYVRISTYKSVFTKDYLPSWSAEIFKIIKINQTMPITYQLQDYTGKPIAGCFYSEEICKTNYPNEYLIEKIIRRKGKQVFVKWLEFDNTHNSWINITIMSTGIIDIQCILGANNKYMIKEMSIVDTETWAT